MIKTIRFWFNNARPQALPQSMMPAVTTLFLAFGWCDCFTWREALIAIIAVFGAMAGHLGINLFDDYFDFKVKNTFYRENMTHQGMRARIKKCDYLTSGQTTLRSLLIAACVFSAIALIGGLIIFLRRGEVILYLAMAAAILGIFYSGPPLRLSYRGLGELLIGLMFGPMLMTGVYYAACGTFNPSVLFISVPIGLLVANVVYIHSIMDYEPDKQVGKMTFAVLLGNKKLMLITLFFILFISYGMIVGGVVTGYLSGYYLSVFITLPAAISLYRLVFQFVHNPMRTFSPRFWMGPLGNWEGIKSVGLDWFMIRWLLARNLLTFFCLIIIVVTLLLKFI